MSLQEAKDIALILTNGATCLKEIENTGPIYAEQVDEDNCIVYVCDAQEFCIVPSHEGCVSLAEAEAIANAGGMIYQLLEIIDKQSEALKPFSLAVDGFARYQDECIARYEDTPHADDPMDGINSYITSGAFYKAREILENLE